MLEGHLGFKPSTANVSDGVQSFLIGFHGTLHLDGFTPQSVSHGHIRVLSAVGIHLYIEPAATSAVTNKATHTTFVVHESLEGTLQ